MKELDIINKIKFLRSERGLTQVELAEAVGIPIRTYQRLEAGEASLKVETLCDILFYLDPDTYKAVREAIFQTGSQLESGQLKMFIPSESNISNESFLGRSVFEIDLFRKLHSQNESRNKNSRNSIGYWELDVATEAAYWSDEMWDIYGLKKEGAKKVVIHNGFVVDDWMRINQKMKNLIQNGVLYHDVHRYQKPNGEKIKIEALGKRYVFDDGRIIVFGIAQKLVEDQS